MVSKYKVAASAACLFFAVEARAAEAPLADIVAAEPTDAGINVTVPTGGCTKKADFQVASQPAAKGEARIEIHRLKSDYCKGNFPDGLKLLFTWDDLKLPAGTKLKLGNAVATHVAQPKEEREASVAPAKIGRHIKRTARGKHWRHKRHAKRYLHRRRASALAYQAGHVRIHRHRRGHRAHCPLFQG